MLYCSGAISRRRAKSRWTIDSVLSALLVAAFYTAISAFSTCAQPGTAADGAPRLALLIANTNYAGADPLTQLTKDAAALANELRRIGFDTEVKQNQSKLALQSTLDAFKAKIKPGSTVLIYLGGYGIQAGRQNYFIPIGAQIWTEADVARDGVSIESILAALNASGARVKLAVLDLSRRNPFERRFRSYSAGLGRVDGFDQDEAEGERDEGTVIARSLLATKGDALEALEFADGLLDARPRFVEDFREESGSVGCSRAMRNDRTNAALAGTVAIGFGVVTFVGDGGARQNIGSDVEQEFEVAAVAGFAPGQMEGERQAVEIDLEVDFG